MTKATEVFEYWKLILKHPQAIFTPDRRRKIEARLRDGYSVDQLKQAIDGCKASRFHNGDNDAHKKYHSIDLIFRNGDFVEKFIDYLEPVGEVGSCPDEWEPTIETACRVCGEEICFSLHRGEINV